jgi:catechol 2,3-dioxygenase-like lactoylglutathione lyase family enzyme
VDDPNFSHFGICVSDLDRSVRFYRDALGFEQAERHTIGQDFAKLMEFDEVDLTSQFMRRGPTAIELLAFAAPPPEGTPDRRPVNRLGLTHLSFRVDDLDAAAARVEEFGGKVLTETLTAIDFGGGTPLRFVYCTDPDGVRVELMDFGG